MDLIIKTKTIYESLKKFEESISENITLSFYFELRDLIFKNYSKDDNIYILFFGNYSLIKYNDYNNFSWDLQNTESFSGGLSDEKPTIYKLKKGLLLVKEKYRTDNLFKFKKINKNSWSLQEFIVDLNSLITGEVLMNIFFYEYIKDTTLIIDVDNSDGYLKLNGGIYEKN